MPEGNAYFLLIVSAWCCSSVCSVSFCVSSCVVVVDWASARPGRVVLSVRCGSVNLLPDAQRVAALLVVAVGTADEKTDDRESQRLRRTLLGGIFKTRISFHE